MKRRMKNLLGTFLLILCFLVGLSLLLYPTISDYWNNMVSSHAISVYSEKTAALSEEEYDDIWEAANQYNQGIRQSFEERELNETEETYYNTLLNLDGSGIMGYIEIPSIDVSLRILHGTSDEVLQTGVGHVEWSSLPVGGTGTHCVLSGHRGLPSAKLFTNLDKLEIGDVFTLCILDQVLTYEVDRILIVEPTDTGDLQIVEGMDYCTLVTCTPYGVNTHRLLVRGHRIETQEEAVVVRVTAEAVRIEPFVIAPILAVPLLAVILAILLMADHDEQKNRGREEDEDEL